MLRPLVNDAADLQDLEQLQAQLAQLQERCTSAEELRYGLSPRAFPHTWALSAWSCHASSCQPIDTRQDQVSWQNPGRAWITPVRILSHSGPNSSQRLLYALHLLGLPAGR